MTSPIILCLLTVSLLSLVVEARYQKPTSFSDPLLQLLRPKVCREQGPHSGDTYVPCPTPSIKDAVGWPCIRFSDLCNGYSECPNGEDESPNMCMFHKLFSFELNHLRRTVFESKFGPIASFQDVDDDRWEKV